MKTAAHLKLGSSLKKWGGIKGDINDQQDLIELLASKASNDEFNTLKEHVDEAIGELEETASKKADLVDGVILESQLPNSVKQLQPQINDLVSNKLDKVDYIQHFRGIHDSYAKLIETIPVGNDGDYAHIKESQNFGRLSAIWSGTPGVWNITGINVGSNTDEVPEGNTNLYFKSERVIATLLNGFNTVIGTDVVPTDNIVQGIGKLQAQLKSLVANFTANVRATSLTGLNLTNSADVSQSDTVLTSIGKLQAKFSGFDSLVRNALLNGFDKSLTGQVTAADSVLTAFGKLQGQINSSSTASIVWVNVSSLTGISWSTIIDQSKTRLEYASYQGTIYFKGYMTTTSQIGSAGGSPLFTHKDPRFICDLAFNPSQFTSFVLAKIFATAQFGQPDGLMVVCQNALNGDNQYIQSNGALQAGIYHLAPTMIGKAKS
ncbi:MULTISPECIES: hypothetical protein [unclassified Acinetobacter]|uniref:hypothetical protein n=1 Tax=unclassified Acinetobacter TaxID=196816 RepID=UPI00124CCC7B|nr:MULTISPECIES: hypothetical protein [unclassified Acinetobacter]